MCGGSSPKKKRVEGTGGQSSHDSSYKRVSGAGKGWEKITSAAVSYLQSSLKDAVWSWR